MVGFHLTFQYHILYTFLRIYVYNLSIFVIFVSWLVRTSLCLAIWPVLFLANGSVTFPTLECAPKLGHQFQEKGDVRQFEPIAIVQQYMNALKAQTGCNSPLLSSPVLPFRWLPEARQSGTRLSRASGALSVEFPGTCATHVTHISQNPLWRTWRHCRSSMPAKRGLYHFAALLVVTTAA